MDEHELIASNNIITNQMGGSLDSTNNYYSHNTDSNEIVLAIINTEINNMILNIKKKLGNNYNGTNQNVVAIMEMLNELQNNIDNKIINTDNSDIKIKILKKGDGEGDGDGDGDLYKTEIGNKYINEYKYDNVKNKQYPSLKNLDSEIYNSNIQFKEKAISFEDVQKRLNNCYILEMLYLIKHEEVMKTFAFTLNLFDKYKYSIKLLLYVLKNLVFKTKTKDEKEPHAGIDDKTCENVKLPKTLIPNIQILLNDQEKVQNVIKMMQNQLVNSNLHGINVLKPDLSINIP
jgi:hypothetical protein